MNIFSIILFLNTIFSLYLGIRAYRKRPSPGTFPLALLMFAISVWSIGYAFELLAQTEYWILIWIKVEYLGISFVSALLLFLVLEFLGKKNILTKKFITFILIIPIFSLIANFTNQSHHLFYFATNVLQINDLFLIYITRGPLYYVHFIYSYLLIIFSGLLLIQALVHTAKIFRTQLLILLFATIIPFVANMIYTLDLTRGFDITALAFAGGGLIIFIGFTRYKFLDITPFSKDIIIEKLFDGYIFLNFSHQIVELNPIASEIFNIKTVLFVEKTVESVFFNYPNLLKLIYSDHDGVEEIKVVINNQSKYYEIIYKPIITPQNLFIGGLLIIRDNTNKEVIEEKLSESEREYTTLFEQMLEGFALYEIIKDENGTPIDYRFLEVNTEFCKLTGLEKGKIINHTVKEVMPGIEERWIEKYGAIVMGKGAERFEQYNSVLCKWFEVNAYSPKPKQFVTILRDITETKKHESDIEGKVSELEKINRIMIDRELKMIDLKEELKKYKQNI